MSTLILGIESSCDETSAAVVADGNRVLSNVINSQIDLHKIYGGVVPEIASRKHIENISYVVDEALKQAQIKFNDLSAIAVTYGPGLVGALLVGVSYAKALAYALDKPLIPIHHIRGHITANAIANPDIKPSFICLVASGGHSHIVRIDDYTHFKVLARTRDDAAGEAFDKIARVLGLGYPGGPKIDKLAKEGTKDAINFPRVQMAEGSLDFSFSGVKTAVINYLHKAEQAHQAINKADVAASFQDAVCEALCTHTLEAARRENLSTITLAGGVACNSRLREMMDGLCKNNSLRLCYPPPILCTDNGAMIAAAGYFSFLNKDFAGLDLNAVPNLPL